MEDKEKIVEYLMVEALDRLTKIAPLIKDIDGLERKTNVQRIGKAICELHDIRDDIYKLRPELQPLVSKEVNELGYEEFGNKCQVIEKAYEAESAGRIDEAIKLYTQIANEHDLGSIKMQAQAGLYRCQNGA